jgi:hypothetical protein
VTTTVIETDHERVASSPLDEAPKLAELFIPCPICHGTTDVDDYGNAFCCSCGQRWTIFGKPLKTVQVIRDVEEPTTGDLILT